MARHLISILFVAIVYSTGLCAEVALVVQGRILSDSISWTPLANISLNAYKAESYQGHNSMDTSSLTATATSDSLGRFLLCMIAHGDPMTSKNDTIRFESSGFSAAVSVKDLNNGVVLFYNNQTVKTYISLPGCWVMAGDTITVQKGATISCYLSDAVFGSFNTPLLDEKADSVLLPAWVKMEECTGYVCIRIGNPESPGIYPCTLTKNLTEQLVYHCVFYINVVPTTPVYAPESKRYCDESSISILAHHGIIDVTFNLPVPDIVSVRLFAVDGTLLSSFPPRDIGKETLLIKTCYMKSDGVYLLEARGKRYHFAQTINIIR